MYSMDAELPADTVKFDETEKTWEGVQEEYERSLGPMRPKDQPGINKERWMLNDSIVVGNNVHQIYAREEGESRSIVEVVWLGAQAR